MNVLLWAIPGFVGAMTVEYLLLRRNDDAVGYTAKDTAANLSMGLGYLTLSALTGGLLIAMHGVLFEYRLFEISMADPIAWVAIIVVDDWCMYWYHRAHHEIRVLWAVHVNHHSARTYNLSTALRQAWGSPFTSPIFWTIMPILGFPLEMVLIQMAVNLLYQFWLHTEAIDKLPKWFEFIFNTPSHHRAHHGRNARYLDCNYGGIFIVWDRMFGTFVPETEKVDYGITTPLETHNPLVIASHEMIAVWRDATRAESFKDGAGYLLRPPGWQPGDDSQTAKGMKRALTGTHAPLPTEG